MNTTAEELREDYNWREAFVYRRQLSSRLWRYTAGH